MDTSISKEHNWDDGKRFGHPVCKKCCIVKRADGKNNPCKGPATLSLRKESFK